MNELEGEYDVCMTEVRLSQHCAYRLQYHVVWVCKYRRKILKPSVRDYLKKVLFGLLRSIPGVEIELIGFDGDHLHMVIPPKYSISEVMGRLKSQSSSRVHKKFKWLAKTYWKENIAYAITELYQLCCMTRRVGLKATIP